MHSERGLGHRFPRAGMVRLFCVALLSLALMPPGAAYAVDERLEQAQQRQQRLQEELDQLLNRIGELEAARSEISEEIERLEGRVFDQQEVADEATRRVAERFKQSFMSNAATDPMLVLFGGDSAREVTERARVLEVLARDSQDTQEQATSASLQTQALADELEWTRALLAEREEELAAERGTAEAKVAQANADVEEVRRLIAREEAERRRREEERRRAEEAARREASEQAAASEDSAPSAGGIACPVGSPRSYTDTYGAPRSGGRTHQGVDILAPMGTPVYAYEDGVISRMSSSSLGGITLYLAGDSGNEYYYAHLSGYVSGLSSGQRVEVGQHIAFVGDTGNASGIPHLHFEVRPGGGATVNPTPYADRACG